MKRNIIVILLLMLAGSLLAQVNVAEQHRSTESIRLKDVVVTDIVDTISDLSTDDEIPTAKAVYEYSSSGVGTSSGMEFEYNPITLPSYPPTTGRGYFSGDSITLHITDLKGIDIDNAIGGVRSITVRTEEGFNRYNVASVNYAANVYSIILDVDEGKGIDPAMAGIYYVMFYDYHSGGTVNDTISNPNPDLLGYEFQYTKGSKSPEYGKTYFGNDTIELSQQDQRGIYINNVIPVSSHIRLRDDSIMTTYEILSSKYNTTYYTLIVNLSRNDAPSEPEGEEIKYVSFINATDITSTGLEKIGDSWRLVGEAPTLKDGYTHLNDLEVGGVIDIVGTGQSVYIGENTGLNDVGLTDEYIDNANVGIGLSCLEANTTGRTNIAIGRYALNKNTTGSDNTAMGSLSLNKNTTGDYNVAIGNQTLQNNVSGSFNVMLGRMVGSFYNYNSSLTSIDKSVFIGYDIVGLSNGMTNVIAIGSDIKTKTSNTGLIGNRFMTDFYVGEDSQATTHTAKLNLTPSATPTPEEGDLYYNSISNTMYFYNGTSWVDIGASSSGITNVNDAGDYNISGIEDWSVPKWSSSTGNWIMDVDSTSTGLSSDYQIKLNTGDAAPGYFDDKVAGGDFITISNASDVANINGSEAIAADVHAFTDVSKIVKPLLFPKFKLASESQPLYTGSQTADGLTLSVDNSSIGNIYSFSLQTGILPIASVSNIDLDDYVIVNTNVDQTLRLKIGDLLNLVQQTTLELEINPLNYTVTETTGTFASFSKKINLFVTEWDGTAVSIGSGVVSYENAVNCSPAGDQTFGAAMVTIDSGTATNDGSTYASIDIVFTHNDGRTARKTFRVYQAGEIQL